MTGLVVLLLAAGPAETAGAFLEAVPQARYAFDHLSRTRWHYTAGVRRPGVALRRMTEDQRKRAQALLKSVLSPRGFAKLEAAMRLETAIGAEPLAYQLAVYGTPGAQGRWGLKVEGHHVSLNFVFEDGALKSATPLFFGANPARTARGERLLAHEEDLGFALLDSLDAAQRKRAVVSDRTAGDMNEANRAQTRIGPPVGLPASALDAGQRKKLRALVEAYVATLPEGAARAAMKRLPVEKLHFAWYGATRPGEAFSYRIQGPDLLVLYFHARFNHAHCVWRTIGRDFGA